jgi:NADPH-dependent glutamate synthase beta subunit-like oxidoreductase/NAD(P)H-flavin reductase
MQNPSEELRLSIDGFTFHDLFIPEKLAELHDCFLADFRKNNPEASRRFDDYRASKGAGMAPKEVSERITEAAPYLSAFVAKLFGVEREHENYRLLASREQVIFRVRKEFIARKVLKKYSRESAARLDAVAVQAGMSELVGICDYSEAVDQELRIAGLIGKLLDTEKQLAAAPSPSADAYCANLRKRMAASAVLAAFLPADENAHKLLVASMLDVAARWCAQRFYSHSSEIAHWTLFHFAQDVDYSSLVEVRPAGNGIPNACVGPEERYRRREGFNLTDERFTRREVLGEVEYCIFCHEREKDSCSHGFRDNGAYRPNPLGYPMKGCPLDQKISESHALRNTGDAIGALAIIVIENPMCPGTGHRICNDCMKACIYQKQEPVNIPQIETGILTDVLNLPWGFEIYSLLTRWNPLNVNRPYALPYNGKKILVVGMGPAGYTLAHYLLNEGFGVVGADALKIEPLPASLTGSDGSPFAPVKSYETIRRKLSERSLIGFGGVSEYGITVRWDKNFLTVLYLNLLRRSSFRIYDGIRFGGTVTVEEAWELGFDHVAVAMGAGKPTIVSLKHNLIRGIRMASDFLMSLQLTGASRRDTLANLQFRLPAAVIGGGLTAVDTATELMAYYPVQVLKIEERYNRLCERYGKEAIDSGYSPEDAVILAEFLGHAAAIRAEQARAATAGEAPNLIPLLRKWGGVTLFYRRSMAESPAYRLNHEEVIKALEEGIIFTGNMSPAEAVPDAGGALSEIVFKRMEMRDGRLKESGDTIRVSARSLFVAAGTSPNTMYEKEHPGTFDLDEDKEFFESYVFKARNSGSVDLAKAEENEIGFFTSHNSGGKLVSYYGDNHPDFEGNVVKAMASAKQGARRVVELFGDLSPATATERLAWKAFVGRLDDEFRPVVVSVGRLTRTIVEVIVKAPRAARKFEPGQFYRLQNYEADSPKIAGTLMMMEGLALTGAWVDRERGLLSLIVLEVGASSRICSMLKPGQRVVVMGPTGAPTEIPDNTTVLLLGGGLGNAVLFSIAKAMKEKNSKVVYFAAYKKREDLFKREEIEQATDVVVYSVDAGEPIVPARPQDMTFVGNIVQAMVAYASGKLGEVKIPIRDATRVIAIGSDRMMAAVAEARHGVLQPYLNECNVGVASINSPMQCMMKAVCAQCVQRHVVPGTNEELFVFTCFNQDQNMDEVDFGNLNSRLKVNSLTEKITSRWMDYVLETAKVERV